MVDPYFDIDDPSTWNPLSDVEFNAPGHYIGIEYTEFGKYCYSSFSFKSGSVDGECYDTPDDLFRALYEKFDLTKEDMREQVKKDQLESIGL